MQKALKKKKLKVGMVTDAGTIDDKSFNQGTWEGIVEAGKNLQYQLNISNLSEQQKLIILKKSEIFMMPVLNSLLLPVLNLKQLFSRHRTNMQMQKFVLIDGAPHNADYSVFKTADNTVSVFFAEHESGFLAAVAASLQMKEGEMGFIGGMEIPPVQKFNWGFQQGIKYVK